MAEKKKKYRVLNPRNIRKGVAIIGYTRDGETTRWYEGDVFEAPDGFDPDGRLLKQGYIEEVI